MNTYILLSMAFKKVCLYMDQAHFDIRHNFVYYSVYIEGSPCSFSITGGRDISKCIGSSTCAFMCQLLPREKKIFASENQLWQNKQDITAPTNIHVFDKSQKKGHLKRGWTRVCVQVCGGREGSKGLLAIQDNIHVSIFCHGEGRVA